MNFVTRNKKLPRQTVNRRLDANAQAWLAQFPGAPGPQEDGDCNRLSPPLQPPATVSSSSFLLSSSTNPDPLVYLALSLGRGHASTEVGLATLDVHSPSLVLSQFSDDLWFNGLLTKISIFQPRHLLLPNTLCDIQPPPRILTYIRNNFPDVSIVPLDRGKFNSNRGVEQLQLVCASRYAPLVQKNQQLYYAMTSAAALLDYVQFHVVRAAFGEHTLRLQIESKTGSMLIDVESAHRLELLYPLYPSQEKRTCLYGVLNSCATRIGQRNLRAKVLQPSCDMSLIRTMHECVAELTDKDRQIADLQQLLGPFLSVDRLARIAYVVPPNKDDNYRVSELLINQALQLKMCLESIPDIFRVLVDLDGSVFAQLREGLQDPRYPYLAKKIHEVVESNGGAGISRGGAQFFQRLYAVRPGINGMLDLNRTIYTALVDDIRAEVQRLKDTYNAPLRLTFSKGRQFHVQMPLKGGVSVERLVAELEVLSHNKNMLLLTNEALCKLNIRIKKYIDEIHFTSTAILCDLLQSIRKEMDIIYDLTGYISELDIALAVVKLSLHPDYCRPTFGDDLRLVQAVHPFLEYASHKTHSPPIPNNVLATAEYNFFIITGPNMGGKTIYLKMVALLQILAQIGCYVPAKSAQFRLCDKVFTRMGFNDSIEQNASSYVVEIREMDYILKSVTANSLVIIDELCRSTNANDGQRIAWKICEQLVQINGPKIKDFTENTPDIEIEPAITHESLRSQTKAGSLTAPFVFFTTHFPGLCRLYDRYLNVVNLNFAAVQNTTADNKLHLTYTHRLEEGETTIKGYGLALARTVRFPPSIMPRAEILYSLLVRSDPSSGPLSVPAHSNGAPLARHRSSNPINRTFSSSNQSHSPNRLPHQQSWDISAGKRSLYDLYANVMEVVRGHRASIETFQDSVNTLLMQFMEFCDQELADALNAETVDTMLRRYFVGQAEVAEMEIHEGRLVDRRESISDPMLATRSSRNSEIFDFRHSIAQVPRSSRSDTIYEFQQSLVPSARTDSMYSYRQPDAPVTSNSRTDRSVTFSENVQFRDIETFPSEALHHEVNRSYNWSEHSLISNLNYERRIATTRKSYDGLQTSETEDNFYSSTLDNYHTRNSNLQRSNQLNDELTLNGSTPRRIPSDTETNMSRPSFKSFIRAFTKQQPTQIPPEPIRSADQPLPVPDHHQAQRHVPKSSSNLFPLFNTQTGRKSRPVVPPKTVNYFADMPDTFWKSMDEFENGTQFQELRDFVNVGIPPVWQNNHSLCVEDLFGGEPSAIPEGRDQQHILPGGSLKDLPSPMVQSISTGSKRALSMDQYHPSSAHMDASSLVTPNIFGDLDNFINRSSSGQASLPKRSRPDQTVSQGPAIFNTQNTINFMVEFESTLSESISMDPAFDVPAYHSIFDLSPDRNNVDLPMEQEALDHFHRTQSRDTESSLNEMDPTQHVVALISPQSSMPEEDEDMFASSEIPREVTQSFDAEIVKVDSTSFVFKMPVPRVVATQTNHMRPAICPSPTQSENLHRIEEYVDRQYDRAIVHPMPSSSTSSDAIAFPDPQPPPEQFPEIHSTSSQSPSRSPICSSAAFRTPPNRRIRTPPRGQQTTLGCVADSLRRFIESNRDSDEDDEDMFADSMPSPTPGLPMNQVVGDSENTANKDKGEMEVMDIDVGPSSIIEIIIPAPVEFQ